MIEYIQVITTIDSYDRAREIAKIILEKRLGACVQILGPSESIYRWKGRVEESKEWIIFIKTTLNLYKELESTIKSLHTYDVPEILALSIIDGNEDYLKWIALETESRQI